MVEIQDPASQAVVDALPLEDGIRVLDYCAGGGGKTLAMAGRAKARFHVHDISAQRMKDLPERAARAGVALASISSGGEIPEGAYDLVLCDAPCSGSGAWRRSPEAKWTLTPDRLKELTTIQAGILEDASNLVGPGGTLAYATCSLLTEENDALVANFLDRHSDFEQSGRLRLTPLDGGDGFFLSVLRRL
jgi:16S rRNA (cytosine967-C5)-methyltransferase